jgi:DnaT-like ssDNA binding protein
MTIFCVQDRTGTAAQLTLDTHTLEPIEVGDSGVYTGLSWNGTVVELNFTVGQVHDTIDFGITTMTATGASGNVLQGPWPKAGTITWLTGANANMSPNTTVVIDQNPANAYCTVAFFEKYHGSRGTPYPASPISAIEQAIVKATDYLDQRYRFKGIKLLQFLADPSSFDLSIGFIDPWLAEGGFGVGGLGGGPGMNIEGFFTPAHSFQQTQWPRQGVVDSSGDSVYGVPLVIQRATCEAALRVLNGVALQPDYDPNLVSAGGVLASSSKEVGPIKVSKTYDTKLGLSFFPSIPQINRMLSSAGILVSGGGRTVIL